MRRPEKKIEVPLEGELHLKATLHGDWDDPLVVLLHGRPGSEYSALPYVASRFALGGFATLALNFYHSTPNTRDLVGCTLQDQANDFDKVVDYAREQGAKHIQAVGHSYGGLTILRSTAQIEGAALWDPSSFSAADRLDEKDRQNLPNFDIPDVGTFFSSGQGYLIPHSMRDEAHDNAHIGATELAKKQYPLLFITGSNSALRPYVEEYYTAADEPKELTVIEGASHHFLDNDSIRDKLFDRTHIWCKYVLTISNQENN